MLGIFVTGTGTDIGKTFVTSLLLRSLRARDRDHGGLGAVARALKPVISGFSEDKLLECDSGQLLAAMEQDVTVDAINAISPWRYQAPLSPDMAALREGAVLPFEEIVEFCRQAAHQYDDYLFVEGAGGVMVPLSDQYTLLDWMVELDWPILLVAGTYLGTISHTLTAVEALRARQVEPAMIILNRSLSEPVPPEETRDALLRHGVSCPIEIIERNEKSAPSQLLARLDRIISSD